MSNIMSYVDRWNVTASTISENAVHVRPLTETINDKARHLSDGNQIDVIVLISRKPSIKYPIPDCLTNTSSKGSEEMSITELRLS